MRAHFIFFLPLSLTRSSTRLPTTTPRWSTTRRRTSAARRSTISARRLSMGPLRRSTRLRSRYECSSYVASVFLLFLSDVLSVCLPGLSSFSLSLSRNLPLSLYMPSRSISISTSVYVSVCRCLCLSMSLASNQSSLFPQVSSPLTINGKQWELQTKRHRRANSLEKSTPVPPLVHPGSHSGALHHSMMGPSGQSLARTQSIDQKVAGRDTEIHVETE